MNKGECILNVQDGSKLVEIIGYLTSQRNVKFIKVDNDEYKGQYAHEEL